MNILRVAGTCTGGLRTNLDILDKELKEQGVVHEVHSIFYANGFEQGPREQTPHILQFPKTTNKLKKHFSKKIFREAYTSIQNIVENNSIDIIHIHTPFLAIALVASYIGKQKNIPLVTTYHGSERDSFSDNLLLKTCAYPIIKLSDKTLVISNAGKSIIGNDAEVIGVPIAKQFKKNSFSNYFNTDKTTLFYPARIHPKKGQLDILQATKSLSDDIKIVFSGNVNDKEYLRQMYNTIDEFQLEDKVTILENIPFNEMPQAYACSHIQVFPTYEEGLGKIIIEGGLCEVPTIAYATGGVPEVITKDTGILVKKGDVRSLQEKIKYLVTQKNVCSELGKNSAKIYSTMYAPEKIAQRHKEIYSSLLQEKLKR